MVRNNPEPALLAIRKAVRADADAAWEIRRAAVMSECAAAYPLDQLEQWTGGTASRAFADAVEERFLVATIGDQVAGTGMIDLATGKIDAIFVHPAYMKRGIGTAMMRHLETLALSHGLQELKLDSTLNAAPFYRSLGFEGDEITPYRSPRGLTMDCVPMTKRLHG
ncbi:GNAT family N-acetyltransferase [Burkholderia sp. S171]|uniref:GNAT family N-acetyltransferase n=1 Tax=Burkholderia sp. S171 TaxID=1641860 RepID=UPI00131B7D1C|nr:GNAT family N-acetyltransferase [Burkholderia sp. S171]